MTCGSGFPRRQRIVLGVLSRKQRDSAALEIIKYEIVTSYVALHEAQRNVVSDEQLGRLNQLPLIVVMPVWTQDRLPDDIAMAEKDVPILLDAINATATHLLTGDKQHFGALYGQRVGGVLIQAPSAYLASRTVT